MLSSVFSDSCDVVLKDGSTVVFRASREEDVPSVRRFFESLSAESQYQRFLGRPRLDDDWIRGLSAETPDSCVLLACCGSRIVGVAGFYRNPSVPERAEIAFAIADALQGRGMGTRLLERLAEHARERHISVFEADVKSDNGRMLDVFIESGLAFTQNIESGVTHLVLSLAPSITFDEKAARRSRLAAAASIRPFFEPRSVAVIGASRHRGKIGSEIFHMLASAPAEHYARTLEIVVTDPSVDSVIAIFIPPLVTEAEPVAVAIRDVAAHSTGKPILAVMMRSEGAPHSLRSVPSYAFPESAAIALARATTYAEWRRKPETAVPVFADIRSEQVRRPIEGALQRGGGWLTTEEVDMLLTAVGLDHAPARRATTAEDAVGVAEEIGFPIALKALGPTLLHKTERNAVILNLADAGAVRASAADMMSRLGHELTGFAVQRMVPGGVEMLVGSVNDPVFGPVVVCGSGGVLAELLADSATRLHPVTARDATEMVGELKCARLLRGYRGQAAVDESALKDAILRVSALLSICPEIQELDLNPLRVLEHGVCVVDARVRIDRERRQAPTRRVVY